MIEVETNKDFVRETVRGGAIFSFWDITAKVLIVANMFVILRFLTVYQYGVYKLAISIFAVVAGLTLSGLNSLLLNDISNYIGRSQKPLAKRLLYEFFILKIFLGLLAWSVLYFGSGLIAEYYNQAIGGYIRILSFLYLINPIINVLDASFTATLNYLVSASASSITEISKLILILCSLFLLGGLNIDRILWISVFAPLTTLLIMIFIFFVKFRKNLSIPKNDKFILLKVIKTYGKWAVAKSYVRSLPESIRLWIIKIFVSTEAVAIFSVAVSLAETIKGLMPTRVFSSLVPRMIKDPVRLSKIHSMGVKYLFILFIALGAVSYLFVPHVIKILFPHYLVSLPFFYLLLLLLPFYSLLLTSTIVFSLRWQKTLFYLHFLKIFSVIIIGLILIPKFGLFGASIDYIFANAIVLIITYFYLISKRSEFKLRLRDFFAFNNDDKDLLNFIFQGLFKRIKILIRN